jgi:hypothetical protein
MGRTEQVGTGDLDRHLEERLEDKREENEEFTRVSIDGFDCMVRWSCKGHRGRRSM